MNYAVTAWFTALFTAWLTHAASLAGCDLKVGEDAN